MARNSVLWEIVPPDTQRVSVITGSMHLNTEAAFKHIDLIRNYMDKYDVIAFEIDMNAGEVGIHDFIIPDGLKLRDFLTGPQERKIKRIIQAHFPVPYALCTEIYPLFTVNIMTQFLLSDGPKSFLDEYLWKYASGEQKEIIGLEDVETHYNVLRTIPLKYQVKAFKDFIFNLSKVKKDYKKLSGLYAAGEIHAIYRASLATLGKMKAMMLYDRNAIMTRRIIEINQKGRAFMAVVGAAHLAGAYGVLHHLRKQGYKITAINE